MDINKLSIILQEDVQFNKKMRIHFLNNNSILTFNNIGDISYYKKNNNSIELLWDKRLKSIESIKNKKTVSVKIGPNNVHEILDEVRSDH